MDSTEFQIDDHRSTSPAPAPKERTNNNRDEQSSEDRIPRSIGAEANRTNFMGKHRMAAAIAHLNQQIQIIQEELDQLETLGESSIVCKEILTSVESNPDALLPVTKGPADVGWDRWFQGAHSSRNRKRWI